MVLFSKYQNGKYHGGKWYCACNEEAKWLTSSKERSKGERFASCRGWGTDRDCKFFLTEADEAKARSEQHTQEAPSTPRTPVTRRTADLMQTPTTGSNSKVNLLARSGKARRVASASESPSTRRFIDADTDDGDEDDLASFVVELLGNEGIAMKSSTESLVRHVIAGRVGKYKAALKTSKDSLAFALEKLNELEGDGAV